MPTSPRQPNDQSVAPSALSNVFNVPSGIFGLGPRQHSDIGREGSHESSNVREWSVVADPPAINVSRRALLETNLFTKWLNNSGHFTKCVLLGMILILAIGALPNQGNFVTVTLQSGEGEPEVVSAGAWAWYKLCPAFCVYLLVMFLTAHRVNRELLVRTVKTFEFFVVSSNIIGAELIRILNFYSLFHDHVESWWYIPRVVLLMMWIPGAVVIAATDSVRMHRRSKLLMNTLFSGYYAWRWCKVTFTESEFSNRSACFADIPCSTLKDAYMAACVNIMVFLLKANSNYLRKGCAFATIRPRFVIKDVTDDWMNGSPDTWAINDEHEGDDRNRSGVTPSASNHSSSNETREPEPEASEITLGDGSIGHKLMSSQLDSPELKDGAGILIKAGNPPDNAARSGRGDLAVATPSLDSQAVEVHEESHATRDFRETEVRLSQGIDSARIRPFAEPFKPAEGVADLSAGETITQPQTIGSISIGQDRYSEERTQIDGKKSDAVLRDDLEMRERELTQDSVSAHEVFRCIHCKEVERINIGLRINCKELAFELHEARKENEEQATTLLETLQKRRLGNAACWHDYDANVEVTCNADVPDPPPKTTPRTLFHALRDGPAREREAVGPLSGSRHSLRNVAQPVPKFEKKRSRINEDY